MKAMFKAACFTVLAAVAFVTLLCLAVIALEHQHWDQCNDAFKGFKPSAHTPSGC